MRHARVGMSVGLVLWAAVAVPAQQAQPRLPEGTKVERNLEYVKDGHERNKLDLYLPAKAEEPLPLVVWVHGGAWKAGSKENCPLVPLAANGYAVASINYRFIQHAEFPAQIEDCKAAIRWLRANAKKYQFDPHRVGVSGASAGGHLVALLGTSGDVKELDGAGGNLDQSSRVQAVIDWFGPTSMPAKDRKKSDAITYISKDDPPFLIVHGDADKTVPISQSEKLTAALKEAGVEATFMPIKGAAHGGPEFRNEEMMKRYLDFFDKHLKKSK